MQWKGESVTFPTVVTSQLEKFSLFAALGYLLFTLVTPPSAPPFSPLFKNPQQQQCKIVLREDVRSKDIMRAMLALGYIRRKDEATLTAVKEAYTRANNEYRTFKDEAKNAGWNTDQLLYSTLRRRCAW